ncbi:GTPase IMAP family member 7-like [Channa argus]|uniref:GTPase IMAP family member 7-like n=1 Tax=Channa argus TaxID=215402 RepID=UPI003522ED2F
MSDITRRIVVLGKTGAGKSSLINTVLEDSAFKVNHSPESGTYECQAKTKCVNGKTTMWIDTPGFFDTRRSEEEMKREIVRCITECAPGPHAFLIVLKVERYTEQEKAVITKLLQYFSEEAVKYTIVIFTHGDQLPEEMTIREFVNKSKELSDLLKNCQNRCHVIDNKYWKGNQQDQYRSNQYQVTELLNTIDKTIEANDGGYYTTEMLQSVNTEIQHEKQHIRQSSGDGNTQGAKTIVFRKQLIKVAEVTTEALLRALLGGAMHLMTEQVITDPVVIGVAAIGTAVGIAAAAGAAKRATEEAPAPSGTTGASAERAPEEHQG